MATRAIKTVDLDADGMGATVKSVVDEWYTYEGGRTVFGWFIETAVVRSDLGPLKIVEYYYVFFESPKVREPGEQRLYPDLPSVTPIGSQP